MAKRTESNGASALKWSLSHKELLLKLAVLGFFLYEGAVHGLWVGLVFYSGALVLLRHWDRQDRRKKEAAAARKAFAELETE